MKLTELKYISEKREKDFNKLGVYTCEDLVRLYPRDFLDLTRVSSITEVEHNSQALVACEVLNAEFNRFSRRPYVKALCQQNGCIFTAIWFNQPYVLQKLKPGEYLFYGRVQNRYGMGASMVNPSFEPADKNKNLKGIIPVYPLAGSLTAEGRARRRAAGARKGGAIDSHSRAPPPQIRPSAPFRKLQAHTRADLAGRYKKASARIALEEYFCLYLPSAS